MSNDGTKTGGVLYIVATPIGNLSDLSPRAAGILSEVDFVAAEDTRITVKLLNHLGIKKPMISCYRHNELQRTDTIIERIKNGESCALCSDAGTPAISDPGEELVRKAVENNIPVIPIPGPSAVITALSASGLITSRFCFEGFIPMNRKTRKKRLLELQNEARTIVIYEAPHKLKRTLNDLLEYLGDRTVTLARELTKIHEEIVRTTLGEAVKKYADNEPRGEFVVIISGKLTEEAEDYTLEEAAELAKSFIKEGYSASEAAGKAAAETGIARSIIYKAAVTGRCE